MRVFHLEVFVIVGPLGDCVFLSLAYSLAAFSLRRSSIAVVKRLEASTKVPLLLFLLDLDPIIISQSMIAVVSRPIPSLVAAGLVPLNFEVPLLQNIDLHLLKGQRLLRFHPPHVFHRR